MDKRIVIIGAGPVGCYAAQLLKLRGFNPKLIEEHSQIGRPVHCTGLIGSQLFKEKRFFDIPRQPIINTIDGGVIHYNGENFILRRKSVAFVVDRERFDKSLSRGLDINFEHKFVGIEKSGKGYIVGTDHGELYADIVIGADGGSSSLRKIMRQDAGIRYSKGLQLRMKVKSNNDHFVEVFLKKSSFFWLVPEEKGIARVGTISNNPHKDIQDFLKCYGIKGEIIDKFGGIVSVGICQNTVDGNIALVGGAACQLKPLTYGGVYFGLKAAEILADCIANDSLKEYDARWKKEFLNEIKIGLKAGELYNRLDEKEIETVFSLLKKQKSFIEKEGDFEKHSRVLLGIIRNPKVYPQLGVLFKIFLKSFLN